RESSASESPRQPATSDVAWFRRMLAPRTDQRPDWMNSGIQYARFLRMTNETTPTGNGAADAAAIMAASMSTEQTESSSSEAAVEAPAEPKPPSSDDLG